MVKIAGPGLHLGKRRCNCPVEGTLFSVGGNGEDEVIYSAGESYDVIGDSETYKDDLELIIENVWPLRAWSAGAFYFKPWESITEVTVFTPYS